jgi:hypothetical protein
MFIKKIPIILGLFIALSFKSQTNSLVVFSNVGQVFTLILNNEIVNKVPESNVKAFNLSTGWQKVKIATIVNNKEMILVDSFLIADKYIKKEFTYVLTETAHKLTFNSIEEPSAPAIPNVPEAPKEIVPLVDNSIYGNLYQAKNNKPVFFDNYNNDEKKCKLDLTDKEIKYALNLFKKCNDDEIVLIYLNTILEKNCYSAIQLNQLISFLKLEMDILNSAKKGYAHVTDKQNINIVVPALKYQSMKDAFARFLQDEEAVLKQNSLNCKTAISDSKFNELMLAIKEKKYENEKTIVAKKQLISSCINTIQAQKIIALFSHDREKIEVMKSAYNTLVDKENAKNLVGEFQFQETRDEFIKYIENK